MQRIEQINQSTAPAQTQELLGAVKQKMGMVPNIVATLAQSPAALGGYLGLSGALGGGVLSPKLREQIALTVAGANACDYCASAHTAVGASLKIADAELAQNLRGQSGDAKTAAALAFVSRIVETQGHIADSDLAAVRNAGFSEEEIVEIIGNVAVNLFTNYFNHIAATEIDFPRIDTAKAA